MFELFARVSKTTVSPSTSLIWRVNQCLRPYVSIYQPQCAHERYIHIKCRWLCCLRTIQLALREIRAPSRRSWLITPSFAPHVEGAVARSPVFVVVVAAAVGVRHRWMPGKPCGIYRVPLIYALLFSWLEKKAHRAAEYPGNWELSACRFWANSETNGLGATGSHGGRVTHLCGAVRASQLRLRQVGLKVYAEVGRRLRCVCVRKRPPCRHGSSPAMNREDHFYPSQVFKDSCTYQRSQSDDYSHSSPPPCLYMSRQVHSVYTPPSMGALEQAGLPDIATTYSLPSMREEPGVPQLLHHHQHQQQQQTLQPPPGYSDPVEQSRYHLPFPWMKTTKSHSHTWKGQWAGKHSNKSAYTVWLWAYYRIWLRGVKVLNLSSKRASN